MLVRADFCERWAGIIWVPSSCRILAPRHGAGCDLYSVRGRDLASTVEEAIKTIGAQVKLAAGYTPDWAGIQVAIRYAAQNQANGVFVLCRIVPAASETWCRQPAHCQRLSLTSS
jgi:hypothetical protein